jgi:hypothetical protein
MDYSSFLQLNQDLSESGMYPEIVGIGVQQFQSLNFVSHLSSSKIKACVFGYGKGFEFRPRVAISGGSTVVRLSHLFKHGDQVCSYSEVQEKRIMKKFLDNWPYLSANLLPTLEYHETFEMVVQIIAREVDVDHSVLIDTCRLIDLLSSVGLRGLHWPDLYVYHCNAFDAGSINLQYIIGGKVVDDVAVKCSYTSGTEYNGRALFYCKLNNFRDIYFYPVLKNINLPEGVKYACVHSVQEGCPHFHAFKDEYISYQPKGFKLPILIHNFVFHLIEWIYTKVYHLAKDGYVECVTLFDIPDLRRNFLVQDVKSSDERSLDYIYDMSVKRQSIRLALIQWYMATEMRSPFDVMRYAKNNFAYLDQWKFLNILFGRIDSNIENIIDNLELIIEDETYTITSDMLHRHIRSHSRRARPKFPCYLIYNDTVGCISQDLEMTFDIDFFMSMTYSVPQQVDQLATWEESEDIRGDFPMDGVVLQIWYLHHTKQLIDGDVFIRTRDPGSYRRLIRIKGPLNSPCACYVINKNPLYKAIAYNSQFIILNSFNFRVYIKQFYYELYGIKDVTWNLNNLDAQFEDYLNTKNGIIPFSDDIFKVFFSDMDALYSRALDITIKYDYYIPQLGVADLRDNKPKSRTLQFNSNEKWPSC